MSTLAYMFVLQGGPLSLKGRILCSSLRKFGSPASRIIACIPDDDKSVTAQTLAVMDLLNVEIRRFEPITRRMFNYPIGSKIDALNIDVDTEYKFLLDTDIMAVEEFDHPCISNSNSLISARRIMGRQEFHVQNRAVFDAFIQSQFIGIAAQKADRLREPDNLSEIGIPVYNSGAVLVRTGCGLENRWMNLCHAFLKDEGVPSSIKFPFADQSTLAILVAENRLGFKYLEHKWNKAIGAGLDGAKFIHYFSLLKLLGNPRARKIVTALENDIVPRGGSILNELSPKDLYF